MGKGLFKGISEAVAGSNFVYITPGNYVLSLIRTKQVVKREGNDDLFISEWKVIDSDSPSHKIGSELSWTANLSRHEAALGNADRGRGDGAHSHLAPGPAPRTAFRLAPRAGFAGSVRAARRLMSTSMGFTSKMLVPRVAR